MICSDNANVCTIHFRLYFRLISPVNIYIAHVIQNTPFLPTNSNINLQYSQRCIQRGSQFQSDLLAKASPRIQSLTMMGLTYWNSYGYTFAAYHASWLSNAEGKYLRFGQLLKLVSSRLKSINSLTRHRMLTCLRRS